MIKRILTAFILISVALMSFSGCGDKSDNDLTSHDFIAMDTVFTISIGKIAVDSGTDDTDVFSECRKLTEEIDSVLSATDPDSDVFNLNSDINAFFDADPILIDVLSTALDISELTGGTYDPTVGQLTSLWNVKGGGPVPADDKIAYAVSRTGHSLISINDSSVVKSVTDVKVDLGGIGKGYAAQKIAEYLYDAGVSYGIISAGRTVGVFGEKPDGSSFKIGIADPFNSDGIVGYLYTESGFISVAGDYEQFFEENGKKYHHIIDPSTGYPSDSGLTSVAVISQNGAAADALSTALMVMGYDKGIAFYKDSSIPFEAIFIGIDGSVKTTDGLTEDRFEISPDYKVTTDNVSDTKTSESSVTAPDTSATSEE
ncbi:MAG: FAD:protein FMN transferase [Ruminococcaceae bacterium]|nr:FAD:protein FMN transferase [Oscillospiraceae bacterium]